MHIKATIRWASTLAAFAFALAACSGSSVQNSIEPTVTSVSPSASDLQFEVGTANVGGTVGLNSLETLRQTSGSSAGASILINAPTIVGPSGFVVPSAPDAYTDAGTNHISGSLQTSIGVFPPETTFSPQGDSMNVEAGCSAAGQCYGIATSYGFAPAGVVNSNVAPDLEPYAVPFYASENAALAASASGGPMQYIGGPPSFVPPGHTSTQDATFPSGYPGYTLGFVDYQAVPVSGTYTLNVVIPTGVNSNGTSGTILKTATSTLNAATVLPTWGTPPTFAPDGTGGGTITTNFGAGGGVTEEYLEIVNVGVPTSSGNTGWACQLSGTGPYYYTFEVTPGTTTVVVPDNIGAAPLKTAQPHTFCTAADNNGTEDNWVVYGFAVDYPLAESAFPASQGAVTPTIVGTATQDDVTTSFASIGPAAATSTTVRRSLKLPNPLRRSSTMRAR